jgi:hypothetical protein
MNGSGGFGAVSVGIPEGALVLLLVLVVLLVGFGAWKVFKFFWALGG